MIWERSNLFAISLDQSGRDRTCGYWYLVRMGGSALTAFKTRAEFLRWLELFNLSAGQEVPPEGERAGFSLAGAYREHSHMDRATYEAVCGKPVLWLNNGDYTRGLLRFDADGVCVVHYLNPNVRDRPNYEHAACRDLESAGRCDEFPPEVPRRF